MSFAAGLFGGGLIWAFWVLTIFNDVTDYARYALLIIVSALAGGATGIVAAQLWSGRIYLFILLIPNALFLMYQGMPDFIIGALCCVFFNAMVISHKYNYLALRASFTLQIENSFLVEDLRQLNVKLEERVRERTEELKRLAHDDVLTGLPNRRGLIEWMEHHFDKNTNTEAAILFLDLDRFKQINDALGHDVGDAVLQTIAHRFNEISPPDCILGRWGGDEFLLVIPQTKSARIRANQLAEQLIEAATSPLIHNNEKLGLGLSVGIAYFPTDFSDYQLVIQAADLTVAEVKRTGRGQTLIYNDAYADTQRRRFELSRALNSSVENGELSLVYQPIVDAQSGHVVALEALSRWRHPELGNIDPTEFIQLAEETDKILSLGQWVIEQAIKDLQIWRTKHPKLKMSVNVSIKQLLTPEFAEIVLRVLSASKIPTQNLVIEVTETLFAEEHLDLALDTVSKLKEFGVEVHIDDFGTGYSSLSRLHEFPVAAIKIDKSFVMHMSSKTLVIIESAVTIAKRMELKVIAEGVETAQQAAELRKIGVDYLQGYFFAKPSATPILDHFDIPDIHTS